MQLLVYLAEENLCTGPPWTSRIPSSLPPWIPPLSGRYPRSRASRYNFRTLPQPSTSCFSLPSQYLSTEQEEMPRPQTSQKGSAGLLPCSRILLPCLRERISDWGEDEEGLKGDLEKYEKCAKDTIRVIGWRNAKVAISSFISNDAFFLAFNSSFLCNLVPESGNVIEVGVFCFKSCVRLAVC